MIVEPTNQEVMDTFPHLYEGYKPAIAREIDDELGLEIVEKPTVYEKYQIMLHPDNSFHASLQGFFDKNGFLTPKQLNAVRK